MFKTIKETYKSLFGDDMSVLDLQRKSKKILDVFTSTMDKLEAINDNITKAKSARTSVIERLTTENQSLDNTLSANTKVISKIKKIFED